CDDSRSAPRILRSIPGQLHSCEPGRKSRSSSEAMKNPKYASPRSLKKRLDILCPQQRYRDRSRASRIFSVFRRIACEAYPGTRVGLAIAGRSSEGPAGGIWVESKLRAGFTFFFLRCPGRNVHGRTPLDLCCWKVLRHFSGFQLISVWLS